MLLKLNNVSISFNDDIVFSPRSLSVDEGDAVFLQGDNGAGKTTFLKVCAGLLRPSSGERYCESKLSWYAPTGVGCWPRLTGQENIKMMEKILGCRGDVTLWRSLTSFDELLDTEYGKCSLGMKSLLNLYVSSLGSTDILIWDEPFAHLSQDNKEYFFYHWQKLTSAKSLVCSGHFSEQDASLINAKVISL